MQDIKKIILSKMRPELTTIPPLYSINSACLKEAQELLNDTTSFRESLRNHIKQELRMSRIPHYSFLLRVVGVCLEEQEKSAKAA